MMRRILMSDAMKCQIEMLAGAQLILRLKIGAVLFKSCTSSRNFSIKTAEVFVFPTTLPPSASFQIWHRIGRGWKRANTSERIDAQLNLEFDQMWATFGIVRYGTSGLDRLNASNLSTVRAKFWRKKKEFDDTIEPDVVPYGGRTCQPRSGYELLIENFHGLCLIDGPACVAIPTEATDNWDTHEFDYLTHLNIHL